MEDYILAHVMNMKALIRNFENACNQAALKDDRKITPEEAKALKRIHKAVERFNKDLEKAVKGPAT